MGGEDVAEDVNSGDLEGCMAFGEAVDEEGEIFFGKGLHKTVSMQAVGRKGKRETNLIKKAAET